MRHWQLLLILIIITFLTYLPSFGNQFVWDDEQFIYANEYVKNFQVGKFFTENTVAGAGVVSNYYRPLTTLSLSLDYQLWGSNPLGFHVTNTLLHIFAGCILFYILLSLGLPQLAATGITGIFLLHPIQTEAVVYINSRGDSLSAVFSLLSCLFLVLLIQKRTFTVTTGSTAFKLNHRLWIPLVPITYLGAILSKEIGIATGGVLALLPLIVLSPTLVLQQLKKRTSLFSQTVTTIVTAAAVGGIYLFLRATTLNFQSSFNFYQDGSAYSESVVVRLLSFTKILFTYWQLLLYPYPLYMERSSDVLTTWQTPWLWSMLGVLVVVGFLCWYEYTRKSTLYITLGTAWFFIFLLPTSGIVAINGMLYEHWLYLPMNGFFLTLFGVMRLLPTRIKKFFIATQLLILSLFFVCLALLTIRQNYNWSTPILLYTHVLKFTDSARLHNNLGMALAEDGQYLAAVKEYKEALAFGIEYPQIYHNLGNVLISLGNRDEAIQSYERAISVSPRFIQSYQKLLELYNQEGEKEEAISVVQLAQKNMPNVPDYLYLEAQLRAPLTASEAAQLQQRAQENFPGNRELQEALRQSQLLQ